MNDPGLKTLMICQLLDLVICFGACLSCLLGFAIAIVDSNLWPSVACYYLLKPPAWLVGILSAYCCFWKYFVPSFEERQFLCKVLTILTKLWCNWFLNACIMFLTLYVRQFMHCTNFGNIFSWQGSSVLKSLIPCIMLDPLCLVLSETKQLLWIDMICSLLNGVRGWPFFPFYLITTAT